MLNGSELTPVLFKPNKRSVWTSIGTCSRSWACSACQHKPDLPMYCSITRYSAPMSRCEFYMDILARLRIRKRPRALCLGSPDRLSAALFCFTTTSEQQHRILHRSDRSQALQDSTIILGAARPSVEVGFTARTRYLSINVARLKAGSHCCKQSEAPTQSPQLPSCTAVQPFPWLSCEPILQSDLATSPPSIVQELPS